MTTTGMGGKARLQWWAEASYNFDKRGLRGCNLEVLPFLRVFPPSPTGWTRSWTVHFGWLWWTVGVHWHEKNEVPS